jgi:hypothetical protein
MGLNIIALTPPNIMETYRAVQKFSGGRTDWFFGKPNFIFGK